MEIFGIRNTSWLCVNLAKEYEQFFLAFSDICQLYGTHQCVHTRLQQPDYVI